MNFSLPCTIIQMVTGLEGSIMECHPEGSLLPKAAGHHLFYYASYLAGMGEFTDTNLLLL